MLPRIIAIDFDGCLVEDNYPGIGPVISSTFVRALTAKAEGCKLILWTCRVEERLEEAVEFCKSEGLVFDAVNDNLPEAIEAFGSNSRKIFAHEYLDDRARGVPHVQESEIKRTNQGRFSWGINESNSIQENHLRDIEVGNLVECTESGVIGRVLRFYKPTACPEQLVVETLDGREYHAPVDTWRHVQMGARSKSVMYDEDPLKIKSNSIQERHQQYLETFACNHGLTFSEAAAQPMVQAHLECLTKMAEQDLRRGLRSAAD